MRLLLLALLAGCLSGKDDGKLPVEGPSATDADEDGSPEGLDCDDTDPRVHPDAEELCNGDDDNCDGVVDEGATTTWYTDHDGDGYGNLDAPIPACTTPVGTVANADDCDDTDGDVHPEATEVCNGADDDCDGDADGGAIDALPWYGDADGDGFAGGEPVYACDPPSGSSQEPEDCDDTAATVHPGADEHCDGVDEDCDAEADDAAVDAPTWYADADRDGFGDPQSTATACDAPLGYVSDATDCLDTDAETHATLIDAAATIDFAYTWEGASESEGSFYLDPTGTFEASDGSAGTWTFDCPSAAIELRFPSGTAYVGETADGAAFLGTMASYTGKEGVWGGTLVR